MCEKITASVIIPTLDRPDFLAVTLRGLFYQSYDDFEIIIVDQGRENLALKRKMHSLTTRPLQWIHDSGKGASRARNIGLKHAKGEIFIGLEDDIIITRKTFVYSHVAAYHDLKVGGVSGRVIESKHKHYGGRVGEIHPLLCVPRGQGDGCKRQPIQTVKGGNMSFRKELLERIGGFDERFGHPSIYEETDASLKVSRLGYDLFFLPDAEVVHLSAPAGGQRFAFDSGQFRFIAYRDRVLLFWNNYPNSRFPLFLFANSIMATFPLWRGDWYSVRMAFAGLREGLRLFGKN